MLNTSPRAKLHGPALLAPLARYLIAVGATVGLLVTSAIPARAAEQEHHHYKLIDLGTFGGPASYFSNGFDGILNNRGTAVGWADTPTPDPHPATCFDFDCFVAHAFQWRNGVLADLGALPGGGSSQAAWISANGLIAGFSQIAEIDPLACRDQLVARAGLAAWQQARASNT